MKDHKDDIDKYVKDHKDDFVKYVKDYIDHKADGSLYAKDGTQTDSHHYQSDYMFS